MEYEIEYKEIVEFLNLSEEPMLDDPKFFETNGEKIPIGMKTQSVFYELLYWEHLKIVHLLDPMHILKNV